MEIRRRVGGVFNPVRVSKPRGAVKIYDRILTVEAQKGGPNESLWPHENFRHKFTSKDTEIWGLSDGSLQVVNRKGRRLWKNFRYSEKDGTRHKKYVKVQ